MVHRTRLRFAFLLAASLAAPLAAVTTSALADTQLLRRIGPAKPAGWSDLVVPRTTGDATVGMPLTTTTHLAADVPVYVNWAVGYNAAIAGSWVDFLSLDGKLVSARPRYNDVFQAGTVYGLNEGPLVVPGGRHTFTVNADAYRETGEDYTDQYDNVADVSFVWLPPTIPQDVVRSAGYAPPAGTGVSPNCTAYRVAPLADTTFAVAAGSANATLVCFDDYVDARHALTHEVGRAASDLDTIEVLAGIGAPGSPDRYVGVFRPGDTASSWTTLQWNESGARVIDGADQVSAVHILPAGRLVDAWRVWLVAGVPTTIQLEHNSGLPNPAAEIALFPPVSGVRSRREALAVSHRTPGTDRSPIAIVPSATGWYPLVVHKLVNSDLGDFYYRVHSNTGTIGVGDPPPGGSLELRAAPSPATSATEFRFGVAQPGHMRLAIYDLAGRLRRVLLDGVLPAGTHATIWDLRDDAGVRVGVGAYWARVDSDEGSSSTSIVVARN